MSRVAPPAPVFRAIAGLCGAACAALLVMLALGAAPLRVALPLLIPGGLSLALDGLSAFFGAVVLAASAAVALAARDSRDVSPVLFAATVAGIMLTLLAGDSLSMVAGFGATSLGFVLMVARHGEAETRDAAARRCGGVAVFAALCVTAGLAALALNPGGDFAAMRAHPAPGAWADAGFVLVLLGAGAGSGLVPLLRSLPPAVTAAPAAGSALFAGPMTTVPLYILIRAAFGLAGPATPAWWGLLLLAAGACGAVVAAVRATQEEDAKAGLACATLAQGGLIAAGLGVALLARAADLPALASLALAAALFHTAALGLLGPLLFLVMGAVQREAGSRNLMRLGGLATRMPRVAGCALAGAATLAVLPPSPAFASLWLLLQALLQALLAALRLGGLATQLIVAMSALAVGFAASLGAVGAIRWFGMAFLGRPRSPRAAAAGEAGLTTNAVLTALASVSVFAGLFPAALLAMAAPAIRLLLGVALADRATLWRVTSQADLPGYVPLGIGFVLAAAAALGWRIARGRRRRSVPVWDGGFASPPHWLPFGDPATQYGPRGFVEPLRRALPGGTDRE